MRKLLTLSLLLLFSVDVFADQKYCFQGGSLNSVLERIIDDCKKGDVMRIIILGRATVSSIHEAHIISGSFCDYNREILINVDGDKTYLTCIKYDDEIRKEREAKLFPD
jgi:hypothetical protein